MSRKRTYTFEGNLVRMKLSLSLWCRVVGSWWKKNSRRVAYA